MKCSGFHPHAQNRTIKQSTQKTKVRISLSLVVISNANFNHRANFAKDAHIAGRIVADMTFLKTQNLIKPTVPEKGVKARKHYKVEFELCLIIEGRNLRFEARWPPGEGSRKMAEGQVSIAAAFKPGTE